MKTKQIPNLISTLDTVRWYDTTGGVSHATLVIYGGSHDSLCGIKRKRAQDFVTQEPRQRPCATCMAKVAVMKNT